MLLHAQQGLLNGYIEIFKWYARSYIMRKFPLFIGWPSHIEMLKKYLCNYGSVFAVYHTYLHEPRINTSMEAPALSFVKKLSCASWLHWETSS